VNREEEAYSVATDQPLETKYASSSLFALFRGVIMPRDFDAAFAAHVGAALRTARQRRKLTIEALAEAAGMARPRLSDYEAGRVEPSARKLHALARALRVKVDSLLP
jgi:ribosome-binding protein aMBF1 (putative translation factor)